MIKVTELISGQSFESMRLAAEYFKIPVSIVTTSIKSGLKLEFDNKEYKFVVRTAEMKRPSAEPTPLKKSPFGKYKDRIIAECDDLSYLKWLIDKDLSDRLRYAIRRRIKELKEEKQL